MRIYMCIYIRTELVDLASSPLHAEAQANIETIDEIACFEWDSRLQFAGRSSKASSSR